MMALFCLGSFTPAPEDMQANITTDDEERDRGFDNGHAGSMDLDKVSIGATHDAGHAMDHFYRATLIERIVGFMERYSWFLCGYQTIVTGLAGIGEGSLDGAIGTLL
jgi:hypothetical protein